MNTRFNTGDRVKMTAETLKWNEGAKSTTGVVVGYSEKYPEQVKLKRDGLKTVEMWHEDAWDLVSPRAALPVCVGADIVPLQSHERRGEG